MMQQSHWTKSKRVIGIDGGGTKTQIVIGDHHGRLLAAASGDSGNIKSQSWERVLHTLITLITSIMEQTNTTIEQVSCLSLGLGGTIRKEDQLRMTEWLQKSIGLEAPLNIYTDAEIALCAGTWGEETGVVLIAGTGSVAYGRSRSGQVYRSGGWGYLLGDEGSAYDIGRQALIAVCRQADGRGENTLLTEKLLHALQLDEIQQFIAYYYDHANVRKEIASIAELVLQAAEAGDQVAEGIIERGASELAAIVERVYKQMEEEQNFLIPCILSGGLFRNRTYVLYVQKKLSLVVPEAKPKVLKRPPVIGAYLKGLLSNQITISNEIKSTVEKTWDQLINDSIKVT